MGRSKNRKKRRLGAIQKQMKKLDPWWKHYHYEDWCEISFRIWCGDFKFWFAVKDITDKIYEEFYGSDMDEYTNTPPDIEAYRGYYERVAKTLNDTDIKGKRFNSKKVTYYRNRFRKKVADGKYVLYNDRTLFFDNKKTLKDYARWKSNDGQKQK